MTDESLREEILINVTPSEVRAALLENGVLQEVFIERAARRGRIRALPGFGAKTEAMILSQIEGIQRAERRFDRLRAEQVADPLARYLRHGPGVKRVTVAGSYRRCKETVGDLDILVTAARGAAVMDHFVAYEEVAEVLAVRTHKYQEAADHEISTDNIAPDEVADKIIQSR